MDSKREPKKAVFLTGDDEEVVVHEQAVVKDLGLDYAPNTLINNEAVAHHRENYGAASEEMEGGMLRRRLRRKKQRSVVSDGQSQETGTDNDLLAPGQRIMFLLREGSDEKGLNANGDSHPALFTELNELKTVDGRNEWRETARWVKFEEDVEEGGDRWSKPHVATLSLHSLFELRSCLLNGTIVLDMEASNLHQIVDITLEKMVGSRQLEFMYKDDLREILLRKHRHQNDHHHHHQNGGGRGLHLAAGGLIQSISDIRKNFSHGRSLDSAEPHKHQQHGMRKASTQFPLSEGQFSMDKFEGTHLPRIESKKNLHFMKKLPAGAEASNVLTGEVSFLQHHIVAFIRLREPVMLRELTEVPVASRFLFILLGPNQSSKYREIGRAIATLMSDEIFHDVAYKARNRTDLLDGVDEFLDQVTVLPPGEWDPNIRIEPPTSIPSQEKRKQQGSVAFDLNNKGSSSALNMAGGAGGGGNDELPVDELSLDILEVETSDDHSALARTGRLFGGLIGDIRRKAVWYASDFRDAFNVKSVATVFFMYFAVLTPIVTFGGLLEEATQQKMVFIHFCFISFHFKSRFIHESLLSGCICGVIYHLFSGQPLTIIGSTGPVLVFETIVFHMCQTMRLHYLTFRLWINVWTALILLVMVATDASSLVSYITRFTEESFATLIAIIFIYQAVKKLFNIRHYVQVVSFHPEDGNAVCECVAPANDSKWLREEKLEERFIWVKQIVQKHDWNVTQLDFIRYNDQQLLDDTVIGLDYSRMSLSECEPFRGHLRGAGCYPLYDIFLMSLVLMVGTFSLAILFKSMRNSCYFPNRIRQVLSDFAVMLSIVIMTVLDLLVGIHTPKLYVPSSFRPTHPDRSWLVPLFGGNPWWSFPLSILPSFFACILIFMDQQITAVIVNRKENKLNKGCGYHLDLFVLSMLIAVTGLLGLPIYVAATVLSVNHVNSLRVESEARAPGEAVHFIGVREQRVTGIVTFLFIGLSVLFTGVLKLIPMPVLYGVFLYMGVAALNGIQLFDRIKLFLMPMKYQPDTIYIRHVPIKVIHLFTAFQLLCLAILWIIKSVQYTSILFPIMLVLMVAVRKLIERWFTEHDLKYLDDKMPDFHLRSTEDAKKKKDAKKMEREESKKRRDSEKEKEKEKEKRKRDENGDNGGMRAVKTAGHLHVPMASGNVMKIPLSCPVNNGFIPAGDSFNLSKEMNASGMWKHIASESRLPDDHSAESQQQARQSNNLHPNKEHRNPTFVISEEDETVSDGQV